MNIVYEVGEPSAAYGHNFSEFVVNQIELPSVEPKAATISAIVQEYLVGLQEPYLIQDEIVASRALLYLPFGFLGLFVLAIFDASFNFKGHLVQLACVQPKAAAFFAYVIGNLVLLREHLVVCHLGTATETFHPEFPF
jgi:hypothetical protein